MHLKSTTKCSMFVCYYDTICNFLYDIELNVSLINSI